MKEWEFQRARLHHRDSAKFTRLTPRESSQPFGEDHPLMALSAVITFACVLGIIGVLFFAKFII